MYGCTVCTYSLRTKAISPFPWWMMALCMLTEEEAVRNLSLVFIKCSQLFSLAFLTVCTSHSHCTYIRKQMFHTSYSYLILYFFYIVFTVFRACTVNFCMVNTLICLTISLRYQCLGCLPLTPCCQRDSLSAKWCTLRKQNRNMASQTVPSPPHLCYF